MAPKPQPNPRLVIIEGKDKGKVITLQDGSAVIGRSKGDVLIQDPRASRSHVAIHYEEKTGRLTFTDLKSLNGTQLNGETVETGELHDGDKLQLGNTVFDCQLTPSSRDEEASFTRESSSEASFRPEPDLMPDLEEPPDVPPERAARMSSTPGEAAVPKAPSNQRIRERLQPQEDMEFDEPAPRRSSSRRRSSSDDDEAGGLRGVYLRIPAKVRNTALVLALLVGGALMYTRNHSEAALDREITAIRKLQTDGKTSEAIVLAEELKKNWAGHSKPEALLGDLLIDQGKLDLAIAAYRSAHKLSPPFPLIHVKLIRASLKAGDKADIKDELAHIDAQIKDGPEIKEVFLETGRLFLDFKELEQPPEKTIILAKALQNKIAPDSSTGYILEAQTLIQMQRPQDAVPVMEKGLKVEPENDWLLENLVYAKLAAQDFPGATATAQNWIKLKPTATKALLVMAYLNYNSKNYAAGLPFLDKLFELAAGMPNEPHHPEALNLQGQIFSQLGKVPEAAAAYKKACQAGFSQACDNELVKNAPPGAPGAPTAPQPASLPNGAAPSAQPGTAAPDNGGVPSLDNPGAPAAPAKQ